MKHLVITGVSRGLGEAMALGFHRMGWEVSGCGTDAKAVAALRDRLGGDPFLAVCDVTDGDGVEGFAADVVERAGAVDLLLNNAGLVNRNAPLWEVPVDEFTRVIDVNLKGVYLVIRAFLPEMLRQGRGVVVNFSSGWGRGSAPEVGPYCASKWGVEGLTAALAQELPAGLAAVALNPGVIDTRMLRSCFGEAAGAYPSPSEWAKVAVPYLAALGVRQNGQALTVPGMG